MQQNPLNYQRKPRKRTHREGELTAHWIVLILCVCILMGALVLSPPKPDSSYLHIGHIPLPDTCSFKNLTGLPCPGCGLTRSIVSGIHGDFKASFMYHRLGLLTIAYICLQFLYRLIMIAVPSLREHLFYSGKMLNRGMIVLTVLFVFNWGYSLLMKS
jgi:hypothetical protein